MNATESFSLLGYAVEHKFPTRNKQMTCILNTIQDAWMVARELIRDGAEVFRVVSVHRV